MRRGWVTVLMMIGVAIASCSSPPSPKTQAKVFDVRIAPVTAQKNVAVLTAVGTVHLRRETALAFTSAGRVAKISVNEGDRVSKGQVLAALDTTTVVALLDVATAEQVRTAAELKRSTTLYDQGWVTKARVDNAKAAYQSAVATTRARRFATSTAQIVAPSGGIILARPAEASQVVDAGTPIIVLGEEAGGYILRVPVPDRDAANLRSGAAAVVRIASLGNATITGFVIQIGGRADPGTGTFEVEIALPSIAGLRAGQIGNADIVLGEPSQSVSVILPPAALFAPRAGEAFVYVVAEGRNRVALRKVMIGEARDEGVSVISGIKAGEWVVVSGVDRLKDQQQVNAVRRTP